MVRYFLGSFKRFGPFLIELGFKLVDVFLCCSVFVKFRHIKVELFFKIITAMSSKFHKSL